jgi:Lon protease-like protein
MPLLTAERRDVCHPTSTGVLSIFEPRYLSMLAHYSRFVHVLNREVVTRIPELARDSLEGGVPRVGVLVDVRSVQQDGRTKLVSYEGVRRVRLLMLQPNEQPFTVRDICLAMRIASMQEAIPTPACLQRGSGTRAGGSR